MALCFRFTSSTFSEILSMKPRISSTCGPEPGDQEKIHRGGLLGLRLILSGARNQAQGQASRGGGTGCSTFLLDWGEEEWSNPKLCSPLSFNLFTLKIGSLIGAKGC